MKTRFKPKYNIKKGDSVVVIAGNDKDTAKPRTVKQVLVTEGKVIVEVDGGTHGTEPETARDRARSTNLAALGYRMFRVRNRDVFDNMDRVLDALLAFVEKAD